MKSAAATRRHGGTARLAVLPGLLMAASLQAKVDLVTLPGRDSTQLTIYNAADLTLVRETRTLTLRKGVNRLEFGWAGTLIDPTSVQLTAPRHAAQVRLLEVAYPPDVQGSSVWTIESQVEGAVPVEITFFTSGLSWRAFYMGTLSPDESTMRLEGYVRVENRSGLGARPRSRSPPSSWRSGRRSTSSERTTRSWDSTACRPGRSRWKTAATSR